MSEDPTARTTVTTVSARPTIRVALPQGWARSMLSGIEAALLGWALVVVPTLIAYAAVSSNQWMVSTTWEDAFHFASDLWGASLGARVLSGDVSYRAVPLLFVLLLIGLTKLLLLQGRRFSPASQWMAIPGFTVTALLLAGGIGTNGFYLGSDALHSPTSAPVGPIPAIPLFGATPASAPGNWVVLALIVFGVALGVYLRLRKGTESLLDDLCQGGIAAVVIAALYLVTSLASALVLGNGRLAFLGPRMSLSALCLFAEVACGVLVTVALSHPVSVAWARELVGAGKARVREHRHHEAAAGGVAPAELAPEVPSEAVADEETAGDSLEVADGVDTREDEAAENVADETQVAENLGDDAEAAQASEEEDAPRN